MPQEHRAWGKRLWRESHSQPCAEPGRAHPWDYPNIRTRNCLWNRLPCSLAIKADISFGCCAVNFRARFCSLFGQGWGNRRVLYPLPHFCPAGSRKSGSSEIMGRKTTAWYLRLRIQGIVFLLFKLILRDGSRDKELI